MEIEFHEKAVFEFVHVKRKEIKKENGVSKSLLPVAIVGRKKDLDNKSLFSMYDLELDGALPKIVCALSNVRTGVIYISELSVRDVSCKDESCLQCVDVTYVGDEDVLSEFEKSFT